MKARNGLLMLRIEPLRKYLFALALLLGISDSLYGQQADLKDLSLEELMDIEVATVTTATKREEKVTSAPGMTMVIDQADIRLRGYRNLKDVLRDLPGMETSEQFFSELGTQVSVRGLPSNNRVVILVNGMRVNPPGGEYFPLRSDFSVREAQQIEVVYGPGSTLYGQDAMSAVINVKTHKAPFPGQGWVRGGAEYGFNAEREIWASFGQALDSEGDIRLTGYVQYHDSHLDDLREEYPKWFDGYRQGISNPSASRSMSRKDYGLNAFLRLELGDSLSIQSWFRESERSSSEGYGPTLLYYVPEARWRDHSWVTEVKHTWDINDRLRLESAGTVNWYEVDPVSRYVFPANSSSLFLDDYKYADGLSLAVEETLFIDVSEKVDALIGGRYTHYDILPKATVPGKANPGSHQDIIDQAGSFVYFTEAGNPDSRNEIPRAVEAEYQRYGVFGEFGWQITPDLRLIAGSGLEGDSRFDDLAITPRAAVIYNISDRLTVKYSYAEAYISPSPYFSFATYDRGDILNASNPDIGSETSRSHEVSLSRTGERLDLGLSLYYGEQSNLTIVSDVGSEPNIIQNPVFLDPGGTQLRALTQTVNAGSSWNHGIDFYGRARVTDRLSTWFSYSYTDYEQTTGAVTTGLLGISEHNFRLGATWAVTSKLAITPSLSARSTPRNIDAGVLGSEMSNPWSANLHILYALRENCDIYAGFQNVTNNHNALTGFLPNAVPKETFNGVFGVRFQF